MNVIRCHHMFGTYHERYASLSEADIAHRAKFKEMQLRQIFASIGMPKFIAPHVRVAVLGCADKRLVTYHQRIFSTIFGKFVELTTFDVSIDHLQGASGVVAHDVTKPYPSKPFDVIYGDILLRFIDPAKQADVLKSSYDALAPNGVALHILNQEDIDPAYGPPKESWLYRVDMVALQLELAKDHIPFFEIPARIEMTLPNSDDKTLIDEFALVLQKT